jgi:hypothetical protein
MKESQDEPSSTDEDPETPATPEFCGDARELEIRGELLKVSCSRQPAHDEDHFDEKAGLGWLNEGVSVAGLTQEERVHAILDRIGVPRGRDRNEFTLAQRTNLFIDRMSKRLRMQVENNMIYYNTCKDAVALLEGAPNSSQFRIKKALEMLRAVIPSRQTPAGIHLQ